MKKDSKNQKISFRRIISNNIFMLRQIQQAAPFLIAALLVTEVFNRLGWVFSDTYLMRYLLNGVEEGKNFRQLAPVLLYMLVGMVVSGLAFYGYELYSRIRKTDVERHLHLLVYQKAAAVELGCYENPAFYNRFVKAIEECKKRAETFEDTLRQLEGQTISLIGNFAMILAIDPVTLPFVLLPLLGVPLTAKKNRIRYTQKMKQKEEQRVEEYSRRTFYLAEYAKELRLLPAPLFLLRRFRQSGERIIAVIQKYGFSLAALEYLEDILAEVCMTLGITAYAVWQTLGTGHMGYGDCMVIINSVSIVGYMLRNYARHFLAFQENALYIENLREFLAYTPQITGGETPVPQTGDLVLEDVSFRYEGAAEDTLRHVNMRFGANERVAIVGHNGAGKTTLVKLLLRLYDPVGTIRYGGVDIRNFPLSAYRDLFSSVMQDYKIFALPASENVLRRSAKEGDAQIVSRALELAGLKDKFDAYENGTDTIMTREFDPNGALFSGGEQQKLAISHVYAKENRFVILDEPSSALDPIAEHDMYERMFDACQHCGMIFISHRLSSAVMADRIYLMENGTVAESGTHASLMAQNGKYADLFRKQANTYYTEEAV